MFFISPNHMMCIFAAFVLELLLGKRWNHSINCALKKEYQVFNDFFSKGSEGDPSISPWLGLTICLVNFILVSLLLGYLYKVFPNWGILTEIVLLVIALDVSKILDRNRRVESLVEENNLEEARRVINIQSSEESETIFQATLHKTSNDVLGGIIGPLFFAFIGGLPVVYLYRTLAVLSDLNEEKVDHPFAAMSYQAMNLIPALVAHIVVPVAGFASGESLKGAWDQIKQKRKTDGIFSIPEAAYAGALALPATTSQETTESEETKPSLIERLNLITLEVAWVTLCFFSFVAVM